MKLSFHDIKYIVTYLLCFFTLYFRNDAQTVPSIVYILLLSLNSQTFTNVYTYN